MYIYSHKNYRYIILQLISVNDAIFKNYIYFLNACLKHIFKKIKEKFIFRQRLYTQYEWQNDNKIDDTKFH